MLDKIPASLQYLLEDETRAFAFLATTMPDGSPQLTPIWFNVENGTVIFNSAKGRVKDKNMRRDPKISLVIIDMQKPLEYIQIRGDITNINEEGARDHINALAQKYDGTDWNVPEGQIRVKYTVRPGSISYHQEYPSTS